MKDKEQIVNELYATYGSGGGILFGIKEKDIVRTIVAFTMNKIKPDPTTCPHCQISPVMCKCCGETL